MLTPTKQSSTKNILPDIKMIKCSQWPLGVYSRFDEDLTPQNAIRVGENVWLDQSGTLTPRPGLSLYGTQPSGTVLGQIYEFVYINTSVSPNVAETWLICMQVIGGVGVVCINKDGGAWIQVPGKTYSATAKAHFEQIFGNVLITNGVDTLSYMNIQTQTITAMTALTQPTGVSAVASGIGGTTYNLRYRVTAANQGETAASPAQTVAVSALRETWNGTTQYVTFTWNRVSGASRYNIYVGDQSGFEYYLDTVSDAGSGTTQSYVDTGTIAPTATRVAPVADATAGPKTTRATNIKGQVWMVGDSDNLGRIWFGGNISSSALDFSSYNGGGWVEPDKGGKAFPVKVIAFRDGHGTPMAAILAKGTNGAGKRYLAQPATTTLGSTVITYMSIQEDSGADGTDSPDGVVFLNDALWYPSRVGFKSTLTQPQVQNILSTETVTNNISPDVIALSSKYMDACVGLAYDQRIYWALPSVGASSNSQIWILDLRPPFNGAWMRPWYINCDWMTLYGENSSGTTKMLLLVGNKIYQLDKSAATNDNGVTFQTNIGSGAIKFGQDDESIWGSVIDVTFVFLRPQGNIHMSVNANTEDGVVPYTDTMNETSAQGVSGWGQYGFGAAGWGNLSPDARPIKPATSITRKQWVIPIDEECNKLTWGVNTTDPGVAFQLAEVIIRYVPIGWKDLDN